MGIRWAPRSLLTVTVVAICVLAAVIAGLGWLLVAQDRDLERQRISERLESAADLAVAELRRQLKSSSEQLEAVASSTVPVSAALDRMSLDRGDAVLLTIAAGRVESSMPLPFYPGEPDRADLEASRFSDAEALELKNGDLQRALAAYQRLSIEEASEARAGALVRLGRVARRLHRPDVAKSAYDDLAMLGTVIAAGRPADLVAMLERAAMLDGPDQSPERLQHARSLEQGLRAGRWRLSRGEYYSYLERVRQWTGVTGTPDLIEMLAEAIVRASESGWPDAWSSAPDASAPVMVLAHRSQERLVVLAVSQAYASRIWLQETADARIRHRAHVSLTGIAGEVWQGGTTGAGPVVRRRAIDTGLPFNINVSADDAGDDAGAAARRGLWAGMFVALGLFIIAGGYVVARGLSKELEVARLQSDFVAAVSHEFRTPVAAVKQLTEVLDDGRVTDEPRRARYYKLLRREGDRLQRLVEGLLDFGKMESHATEYRFEELDAGDVVRGITDEFAEGDGAPSRLSVAVESDLAIRGDREAIGRALRNLIDNALKYSPSDSPITVEAAPSDGRVIIRVRDWGPGIAPAEHRRIFSKFVRGESAKATGAKGTGIGLAMVAHIMRAHRGEVRVESLPGEGATFSLVLPTGRSL